MSIAWSMEKIGGFTVQSAYNLALKLSSTQISQASSSVPDGDRKLRSHI
jgi:predicted secreted protein